MSRSRHTTDSPSVTLEKGTYRMRAPRPRAPSSLTPKQPKAETFSTHETRMGLLIILLITAIFASFGFAYHLYTTRWANTGSFYTRERADEEIQVPRFDLDAKYNQSTPLDVNYLSYLPHSGFHNQRIAFENALVLSRLLNRTLLVPPIRLGKQPLRYVQFNRLQQFLILSGKEGLQHCTHVPPHVHLPNECTESLDYTFIPWSWLTNLTTEQPLVERWNFTDAWVYDHLHIFPNETYALKDIDPYEYRFLDQMQRSFLGTKYRKPVYIPELAESTARLLQLGTLFGSSRLHLRNPENKVIRKQIRRSMALSNPVLNESANMIAEALGGLFLSAHVRVGDGQFHAESSRRTRLIWWRLVHQVLGFGVAESTGLERALAENRSALGPPPVLFADPAALRTPHPPLAPLPDKFSHRLQCRSRPYTSPSLAPLNVPLFISTDAPQPIEHPSVTILLRTFPCTFFLSDFADQTYPVKNLKNSYDGLRMAPFVEPLLDAMVAGRAWAVVGTEGSTFSAFVQDVLWRTSHGWDIVVRG